MKDLNHITVIGRLTRDAELKDGRCSFSIAYTTTKKECESWVDEPNYLNLMIFGKIAESLSPRLTKGTQVAIAGHLKQSRWEKDGQKMSATNVMVDDIQLVGGKKSDSSIFTPANNQPSPSTTSSDEDLIW